MSMAWSPAGQTPEPQHTLGTRREESTWVLYVSCGGGLGRPAGPRDRAVIRERLAGLNLPVTIARDIPEAFERLAERRYALCLLDLAAGRSALAAIRVIRAQHPQLLVVGIADPGNPASAAEAIHAGFVDLLPWPFDPAELLTLLANAQDRQGIDADRFEALAAYGGLVANSAAMQDLVAQMRRAPAGRGGVMACGEPGSGRAMVARALHDAVEDGSSRPFVTVDCATDEPEALERALFGTVSDRRADLAAASGAERVSGASALVSARRGTLFLREMENAPARVQIRLARVLRDREAVLDDRREPVALDVRPMASAGPGVDEALSDGRLRRDLYERLAQTRLDVPPLRRRREDIPVLAARMLRQACVDEALAPKTFSRAALALLAALAWRGNGTELESLVTTLSRSSRRLVIQLDDVLQQVSLDGSGGRLDAGLSLRDARAQFERDCISAVLMRHHGRVGEAAKALGIQRTNLYRKVRQLNVARSLLAARR